MEQSQLVELIKTLNLREKEQILQFIELDFFPWSKLKPNVGLLLKICLKHPWHDPSSKLRKDDVLTSLFPGQVFVEGKLEKIMVDADKLIRSFLLLQHYFREENEFQQTFDFAEIIRLRGLDSRYKSLLSRMDKMQKESIFHNNIFFHNQYLLEYAIHNEASLHNQIKGDLNIPATLDALEMHLCLNQLALLNAYLLQQKGANIEISDSMQNRLNGPDVPLRYLNESSAINVNYIIFKTLKKDQNEPEDAHVLFKLLINNQDSLSDEMLRGFYAYLRSICVLILRQNPEREEIYSILYDLYKDNLERGYLHYEGTLHPSRYLAISEHAAITGNHEWALDFIKKYQHEIVGENETQDLYRLNLAIYLFSTGKYSDCLDNIPPTSPYVDYLLAGKRLELKALYEIESSLLPYKLDAFKMFLSRTSKKLLSDTRRQRNVDFVNIFFRIVSVPPGDKKRAARLVQDIEAKKQAAEWRWLLAKARLLK